MDNNYKLVFTCQNNVLRLNENVNFFRAEVPVEICETEPDINCKKSITCDPIRRFALASVRAHFLQSTDRPLGLDRARNKHMYLPTRIVTTRT